MEGIRLFKVDNGVLLDITSAPFKDGVKENDEVHDWICKNPEVIEPGLTVIGRRVACGSKELDVLAIDSENRIVVIEAKRDKAPREVVGQVIDYASRLDSWESEKYAEVYMSHCSQNSIPRSLKDSIFDSLSDELRLLIVCFGVDDDTKRMVNWLAEYCGLNISFSVFSFGAHEGQRYLAMHVVQEQAKHVRGRKLDPLRRSLIEALYSHSQHRSGHIESWAGQGGVYGCTLTVKSSGVSGDVSFGDDKRTPILRISNGQSGQPTEKSFADFDESKAASYADEIIDRLLNPTPAP